ncbi:hypothetical protein CUMW_287980 [Citrus unshiu]|uniref:Uncharacterized protein n=1 Tax=Citrus unshiu TaxID=55188 RepID=A0A2H5MUV0_CITUN|nr:hypothetical protein CUMW_287980 [Citrus unshiu]
MNHQPPSTSPRPPLPPPSPTTTTGDCGNCGAHVATFLFNVRLRGIHRRLCTKCVLKLHPSSFCPVCFAFYDSSPPHPSKRQACSQCSSFTHSHCATSPPSPYLCRLCSPSSSITLMNDMSSSSPKRIDDKSAAMASGSESFFNAVAKKESLSQDFINTSQTPNKQGLFANKVKPEWNGIN